MNSMYLVQSFSFAFLTGSEHMRYCQGKFENEYFPSQKDDIQACMHKQYLWL